MEIRKYVIVRPDVHKSPLEEMQEAKETPISFLIRRLKSTTFNTDDTSLDEIRSDRIDADVEKEFFEIIRSKLEKCGLRTWIHDQNLQNRASWFI